MDEKRRDSISTMLIRLFMNDYLFTKEGLSIEKLIFFRKRVRESNIHISWSEIQQYMREMVTEEFVDKYFPAQPEEDPPPERIVGLQGKVVPFESTDSVSDIHPFLTHPK